MRAVDPSIDVHQIRRDDFRAAPPTELCHVLSQSYPSSMSYATLGRKS